MNASPHDLEFHQLSNLFPLIEGAALNELVADIESNGVVEPIVLFDGKILDGRNRYVACRKLGIAPPRVKFDGEDPLQFVISKNLRRRHLRDSQRALIAARIADLPHGGDAERGCHGVSHARAAELLNVSTRTLRRGRLVVEKAAPEVRALVERGQVSLSAASKISKLALAEQVSLAAKGSSAIAARGRKLDRLKGRQGRSEYAILWRQVDEICAALEAARIDKAHMSATKLVAELARIAKSRRA